MEGHGQARAEALSGAALTPAERQARYRAARQAGTPVLRYRKPEDRRSRPQRWQDAVVQLVELQAGYQNWLDSLPESFRDGATAEALATMCGLDLSELRGWSGRAGSDAT